MEINKEYIFSEKKDISEENNNKNKIFEGTINSGKMEIKKVYAFSEKILYILKDVKKYKHRLFEGSVRSSKSHTANIIALREIKELPKKSNILLSGTNAGTLKQNVIGVWEELLNIEFKIKKDLKGEYFNIPYEGFEDKNFYIRGHDKNGDDKKIQGMTLAYWYCDEATNMTEDFFNMALSRLSLEYSKSILTCNPGSPYHYLKVNYIDKSDEIESFKYYSFTMEDNPTLDKGYIKDLKQMYNGVFYDRYILGKWVIAEGLIFSNFNKDKHVKNFTNEEIIELKRNASSKMYIGIDYGTNNATVFLKFLKQNNKFYLLEEYYHSGRDTNIKKSTSDYALELKKFIGEDYNRLNGIYIDPSASYFFEELKKIGIGKTLKSNNNVMFGIQKVQDILENNYLIINEKCVKTIKELEQYAWDENAAKRGEDKPLKINDHCMDALRYVIYTSLKGTVQSTTY